MKLWKIFRFEFAYLVRRLYFWLYLATLFFFTIAMNYLTTPGDGVYPNNTLHITGITVIGGLIWLIMGAAVAGEAAARDVKMRMHPLIFTAPITKLDYLGGRFLAAFAVNAILILCLPLGVLISFYLPGSDEGELLPFRLLPYLNVYFLIALPNAFVATALQFGLAALSRQVMSSYLASLLLAIVAQILAIAIANLFGNWDLVKLLDPVGIAGIVNSELATWTPTEKNTRLVTLEGMFLWNRILWLSVAVGALAITYLRFNFNSAQTNSLWRRFNWRPKVPAVPTADGTIFRATTTSVPQVQRSFDLLTYLGQTRSIAWTSFKKIARHPLGLTLVAALVFVSVVFGNRIMTHFEIPMLPTTQQMLAYLITPIGNINTPWVVIPLLIIYFMGQLVWYERDARLSDIADAAPVPESVVLAGKFLGLSLMTLVWMALLMAGGILMQLQLDYDKFEIGLYLQALFGLQLIDYLLFAMLALVVHVVVNQKYISYIVMLLVFIFMSFPSTFGVEHSLLIFGAGPGWWYTDMRGFGSTLGPWLLFKLYWIAWALLLSVTAKLLWARGREQSLNDRLQFVRRRFTRSTFLVALIALCLILFTGCVIFYNTNVLNQYQTGFDLIERRAEYERRYGQYQNMLQPQLASAKLNVELYPDRQETRIKGSYTLINKSALAIDSIHVGSSSFIEPGEVNFNRPFTGVLIDNKRNHHIYALKQPLQPGDSLQLNFVIHYKEHGFLHRSRNTLVTKNGTYFTNADLLPTIGYQHYREINDPTTRKKHMLPARSVIPSLFDSTARKKPFSSDQIIFEAIIGTASDEVAVAPGVLHKTWTVGNRRYFHYKTDAPIGAEYSILSGSYAMKESTWNKVAIRIYHHPNHAKNIDRMLKSVKASMEFYTEQFGPYPYPYITIVERAGSGGGATADASIIYYGEQYSLMDPDDSPNGFDLPYYILAHEMAHQWWGLARLTPAYVEGAGVMIEGLAVYSGMQVLEQNYGDNHLRKFLDYVHSFYEMPRSLATTSLLQANEEFLYYRKGGLAMYALSRYIGKEKVNGALRDLLQKRLSGELTVPTTLNLYEELQKATPDSFNYLLNDLFKQNTYWRLKSEGIEVKQTKDGTWQVSLKVQAQKVVVDKAGKENEVPMNDWLEIGFYEKDKILSRPLYLQMHRIQSGKQTIKITLPRKPDSGGIDPNYLMIDVRRDDNVVHLGG